MAITTERYVPDRGAVSVNSTQVEGSVKTVSNNAPRRSERIVNSLGGSDTEVQDRAKAGNFEVTLEIFDDQSLNHNTTGLLGVLFNAYENGTALTEMSVAPAGAGIGSSEYTFTTIEVVQCPPFADMDADTEDDATLSVILSVGSISSAAIT